MGTVTGRRRIVSAWEWEAGPASGLSDDRRRARRRATGWLRSGVADKAVMCKVIVVPGQPIQGGNYLPVAGTRVEAHMDEGRIRWRHAPDAAEGARREVA
jgi:hypothetical protein